MSSLPSVHRRRVNGVELHYAELGEGPLVLLLHGFPETHGSWQLQWEPLVRAGYRVVAPDLRGYGQSEAPRGGYDLDTLARDVVALGRALDPQPFRLVGHDWGGAITWHVAERHPEALRTAVVLCCAHPWLLEQALLSEPRQLRKSWYMLFFQLPWLPERWLARRGGAAVGQMFRRTPGAERALPELVEAARREVGRRPLRGPLAYYRTALRGGALKLLRRRSAPAPLVQLPVTLLWSELDACFVRELAERHHALAPKLRLHLLRGVGHFAHQEAPEQVNALLLDALAG